MFLSLVGGSLIILSIFSENLFYFLPIMVLAILQSKISCPHCANSLLKDKNGWYIFSLRSTCRHCAKNTNECVKVIEEVQVKTKKRKKKK